VTLQEVSGGAPVCNFDGSTIEVGGMGPSEIGRYAAPLIRGQIVLAELDEIVYRGAVIHLKNSSICQR
jgi:hypothetical protein